MKQNTKLRIITGTVYFLILVLFFALKILIRIDGKDYGKLCFDFLIVLFGFFGTYEMLRAFGDKIHHSQKIVVMVFSLLVLLTYAIVDFVYVDIVGLKFPDPDSPDPVIGRNYAPQIMLCVFMAGISILFGLLVFAHKQVSLESTGYSLLSYVYPTVFLVVLIVCNHLERYSDAAIAFVFAISPCADCMAYAVGKTLGKKLPAKMAPNVSPNKTLVGGFGGLIGGAIGALAVFFLYYGLCKPVSAWADTGVWDFTSVAFDWADLILFLGVGVLTSAFAQFGDLVESAIKRKLDVKDMGKILPGHGGVLDRIDSSLYAGLVIALVFVVKLMTMG